MLNNFYSTFFLISFSNFFNLFCILCISFKNPINNGLESTTLIASLDLYGRPFLLLFVSESGNWLTCAKLIKYINSFLLFEVGDFIFNSLAKTLNSCIVKFSKFSINVKELRKQNGLNQTEFGKKIGVSRNIVANWECDKSEPSLNELITISKTFDIGYEELLKWILLLIT